MRSFRRRLVSIVCGAALLSIALPAVAQVIGSGRSGGGQQGSSTGGTPPAMMPPAGTSAISGDVVDRVNGRPIAGAVVTLRPEGDYRTLPLRQATDAKGRFVLVGLPSGSFVLSVSKFGYFDGRYGGNVTPNGRSIALIDGQWFRDARVRLERPGAISGLVLDEHNEPLVGAYVRALVQIRVAGRTQFGAGPTTTTDDRGAYRLPGLTAGRYLVLVPMVQSTVPAATPESVINHDATAGASSDALPPLGTQARQLPALEGDPEYRLVAGSVAPPAPSANGRPQAYSPTYYPSSPSPITAMTVEIGSSEERSGIDIVLRPAPGVRVTGVVDGPPDALQNLTLRLIGPGSEGLGNGSEVATALVGSDGRFGFLKVPAGAYTIEATRTLMEFNYRPNGGITASATLPNPPATYVNSGGVTSTMSGPPGTSLVYLAQSNAQYWGRQSIGVGAQDVSGVVVHMSSGGTIAGRVVSDDPSGSIAGNIFADAATGDPSLGRPNAFAQPDGAFRLVGLAPGAFFLRLSGARVKSIAWNQEDYTTRPFDTTEHRDIADVVVTVTAKTCALSGSILDLIPRDAGAVVVAFPVQREQWANYGVQPDRFKSTSMTSAGAYRFASLPAGDYYVVAVTEDQVAAWQDPQWLAAAAGVAQRVSLVWGETKTVDVKYAVVRSR